jgi:hypothetical protein
MQNKFKKRLSTLVLSFAILSGVVVPKDASAYLIIGGADQWRRNWNYNGPFLNTIYVVTCLYFLPFCLLDEKNSSSTTTIENLVAQGFTAKEVETIINDQKLLTQRLFENNMLLEVRPQDTRETIRKDVLSIAPELSDLYLNFLFEMKGL